MSPYLPVTAARDRRGRHRRGRSRRRDRASARARRDDRQARPEPGGFPALPAAHQAIDQSGHQSDHRRRALHDRAGAREAGRDLQAGGRLAQHGLDEFRPVPDAQPLQGVQARLGAAGAGEFARSRVPQHLQGHRIRAGARSATPARASSSSATTPRISTISRISWSAASSSRRCSCRPCSAFSAASARTRKTCCT